MSPGRGRRPARDPFDPGRGCRGKRRYTSQGEALVAAMVVGVERERRAYRCAACGHWHLASRLD